MSELVNDLDRLAPVGQGRRHPHIREVTIQRIVLRWVEVVVGLGIMAHPAKLTYLVRVDHRQHLTEALANTSDSLSWVALWHLSPRHKLYPLPVQISQPLLATGAVIALLREHRIFFFNFSLLQLSHRIVDTLKCLFEIAQLFLQCT